MISAAAILMLSSMLYSLRLSSGSFPKPLSAKEEQEYLEKAAAGDLEARNILIERNLRLVAHIMKKYYAQTSDQEDLISIGTIGLIKAVSTFDAGKGIRGPVRGERNPHALPKPAEKRFGRLLVRLHRNRQGRHRPVPHGCGLPG